MGHRRFLRNGGNLYRPDLFEKAASNVAYSYEGGLLKATPTVIGNMWKLGMGQADFDSDTQDVVSLFFPLKQDAALLSIGTEMHRPSIGENRPAFERKEGLT